jgi:hypothetical protein
VQSRADWERENRGLIAELLGRLRSFRFDSETDRKAAELVQRSRWLFTKVDVTSFLQLRMVSLLNEYFEAKGANEVTGNAGRVRGDRR